MKLEQLDSLDTIRQFLKGTQAVAFSVATSKQERYCWIQKTLVKHHYMLGKADKGTLTRYLIRFLTCTTCATQKLTNASDAR
ncbi:MAG: hypothetical protein V3T17_05830 [Pseudomonadales bacterium]